MCFVEVEVSFAGLSLGKFLGDEWLVGDRLGACLIPNLFLLGVGDVGGV